MQSRLTQVLDEQSSTGKALLDIYSSLGIDVFDKQTGQLRSFYDIMVDLNKVWGTLNVNEQQNIALQQAGEYRPFKVNCWKTLRALNTKTE